MRETDKDLNNIKKEFPKMPDELRAMVEKEVARQLKIERPVFKTDQGETAPRTPGTSTGRKSTKISRRKITVIAFAAAMALGTTAFAGTNLYRLYMKKVGSYGVETAVNVDQPSESTSGNTSYSEAPDEIPVVQIKTNYLPEGMVSSEQDPAKMHYAETPNRGGISMALVAMDADTSSEHLTLLDKGVLSSEELTIAGHNAVYLEINQLYNKTFYVLYPEIWQVLQVYAAEDVTKEEVIKVIENTELVPTGETRSLADAYTWSDFAADQEGEESEYKPMLTATEEEMKNIHQPGETFSIITTADTAAEECSDTTAVSATITDVLITDDLSIVEDFEYIGDDLKNAISTDGKLLPNTIQYIKSGNGIDTLDEIVKTEEVPQKLVYVTVEYTNTGSEELHNVLFLSAFTGLRKDGDTYTICDMTSLESSGEYDRISFTGIGRFGEMQFFDVQGGERNNNHISTLMPGETVVVHMACVINEDDLPYLYLNLSPYSSAGEFTEQALATGYVDLRS